MNNDSSVARPSKLRRALRGFGTGTVIGGGVAALILVVAVLTKLI